jgi:uncharacterized membrane protein (UPF0127 family)
MPVVNLTKKTWLATKVRRADNFITRLVGLLRRKKLGAEEAVWIVPCKGIHTIGMKFAIDVVFLNKGNEVVKVVSNLIPNRATGFYLRAHSVLELPKGTIVKSSTEVGDRLEVSLAESSMIGDLGESPFNEVG